MKIRIVELKGGAYKDSFIADPNIKGSSYLPKPWTCVEIIILTIKGPLLVTVRLEGSYIDRFPVHGGTWNALAG